MTPDTNSPRAGDRCPRCGRRLSVYTSRKVDGYRIQYIGCRKYGNGRTSGCGYKPPDNVVVTASTNPPSASTKVDHEPAE